MRKDYLIDEFAGHGDELSFVADYWTRVWERQGGPRIINIKITGKEEYRLMSPYLVKLPGSAKIIDGGCGLGEWVIGFSNEGYDVVGMDISQPTINQLTRMFPEEKFEFGDIRQTGYMNNCFDAYFSWGVFEHFEAGPGDCLREAFRILKPGGLLFITVPLDNLRQSIIGTFASAEPSKSGERFYQYRFTRSELAREISLAGFEIISFKGIHKRQGVLRALHHEFGMPYHWLVTRALAFILSPFIPAWSIAHMMMGIARKPSSLL